MKNGKSEPKNSICGCGRPRRKGQRNCTVCHAADMRQRRHDKRVEHDLSSELVKTWIYHRDRYTLQRFEAKISTEYVNVITDPPEPEYVGLPIGFLSGDEIIIWQAGNIIKVENLKKLTDHGIIKRRQAAQQIGI